MSPTMRLTLTTCCLYLCAGTLQAQQPTGRVGADSACGVDGEASMTGFALDRQSGLLLPEARVTLTFTGEHSDCRARSTETDDNGVFRFEGLPPEAEVQVEARWRDRASGRRGARAGGGRDVIRLEIDLGDPSFILFSVVDSETGGPVTGASLRLLPLPLGGVTDSAGRVGLPEVPPGDYTVTARHLAFAPFEDEVTVSERSPRELRVRLTPRAIAVAPLEVTVTRRDPVLVDIGFYDRMERLREGQWFTYWDMEPYALLSTFLQSRTFLVGDASIFVNGKPVSRIGYESVNEIPFGKIHGVEHVRCAELPERMMRWLPVLAPGRDCWAVLIWRGARRIRQIQEPREATDGVSRLWAKEPGGGG